MKTQTWWPIFWRIFWRVALFALVGAVSIGPLAILTLSASASPVYAMRWSPTLPGLLCGAFCLGVSGFLTAQRRDGSEALQMAFGGAWLGILSGALIGSFSGTILLFAFRKFPFSLFVGFAALLGALLGSIQVSLHPKYAPREEPLLLFEDAENNIEYSIQTGNQWK